MSSKGFITAKDLVEEYFHHESMIKNMNDEFLSRGEFEKRKGTLLKYLHEIDVFLNTDEFREIYKILDGEKE